MLSNEYSIQIYKNCLARLNSEKFQNFTKIYLKNHEFLLKSLFNHFLANGSRDWKCKSKYTLNVIDIHTLHHFTNKKVSSVLPFQIPFYFEFWAIFKYKIHFQNDIFYVWWLKIHFHRRWDNTINWRFV